MELVYKYTHTLKHTNTYICIYGVGLVNKYTHTN